MAKAAASKVCPFYKEQIREEAVKSVRYFLVLLLPPQACLLDFNRQEIAA